VIFRSAEQKQDVAGSWHRPDRPFFAAGACHILATAFLDSYPNSGYRPFLLLPDPGFRGTHVFVSNGKLIFDYHGYTDYDRYFRHHQKKIHRFFPSWRGQVLALKVSPIDESFCREYSHRLPSQYLHDPLPRALAYLKRFPMPT